MRDLKWPQSKPAKLAAAALLAGWAVGACAAPADRDGGRPVLCDSFGQGFARLDKNEWYVSDGWSNGGMFDVGWTRGNVRQRPGGVVDLMLTPERASGRRYAGAEVQSHAFSGYGRYEVSMRAARGSGVVSSLFLYTGEAHGDPMHEIDIEFLGRDTTKMHVNYFTNGKGGHESWIDLGFDAADGFNDYAFEWRPDSIRWFANGKLIHEERGARGPLPSLPGKIILNLWAGKGVEDWLGPPPKIEEPIVASYKRVSFTPLEGIAPGRRCRGDRPGKGRG